MVSTPLSVVFLGSDDFSLPILEALLERGANLPVPVNVSGIVTQPDRPTGRGRKLLKGPVKRVGEAAGIPVYQWPRVGTTSATAEISELNPDLFVVASFGQILSQQVLDIPRLGSLNLHPSLLPRYRGPSPVVAPILAGDVETGVTLMEMELAMDSGPIVAQARTRIDAEETASELQQRLAYMSRDLLLGQLPLWTSGEASKRPQDDSAASFTRLVSKGDGLIDWTQTAVYLARMVRAYNPWPVAHTHWGEQLVRVFRARAVVGRAAPGDVLELDRDALLVGTGEGVLRISEMQLSGGRRMTPMDVLRGRPSLRSAKLGAKAHLLSHETDILHPF